jgi:hypothetical protein
MTITTFFHGSTVSTTTYRSQTVYKKARKKEITQAKTIRHEKTNKTYSKVIT